ncbi:MAG: DUF3592 domain-containing protein [Alphaproteobacteria bacterium]|nr:DUF3592 domain-containing protein [Alphaproteobacteria bacterium]
MDMVPVAIILIGLIWVAAFAWAHFRAVGKAKAAETWPTAPGRVVSCRVDVEESEDNDGNTTTWYNPVVTYGYAVAGRELQGTRLRFGNYRSSSRRKAEAALAPYTEGTAPLVRYNPEKPEECVLETRKPGPAYLFMAAAGLIFIVVGIFIAMAK